MTRLSLRTAALLTIPPLMWSGNAVVGRLMVGQVPPLTLNALRWVLVLVLLLPLAWRVLAAPDALRMRWPHLLLLGTLGVGMYNALQYLALVSSTPINVTLIASSMPVWMIAVGHLFYGERVRALQLLGAVLSLAGVLLVVARGDLAALARVHFVPGDLYIIVAAIAWSAYSWRLARPPAHMLGDAAPQVRHGAGHRGWDWSELLLVQVLFGLIAAGSAAGLEQALGAAPIRWSWHVAAALLFVALGPSLIAYRCWGLGVAAAGPAAAAFFSNLTPVFAALLSVSLLGEAPQWFHGLSFVLIIAGILVSSLRR